MRQRTVTILLIWAIGLVATLGFLSIGIMDHGEHMHCPFSFVTGIANCPMTMGPTDGIAHHVATLQGAAKVPVKDIGPVVVPLALLLAFSFFPVLGVGRDGPSGGIRPEARQLGYAFVNRWRQAVFGTEL